ncbi:MAG: putative DNA binding domain-containing protein [Candidatus Methanoplasma sp.]|jgi:ATP-dependent DNA helicase RecG|nr:putative DNA binding domain-containing protein [Candidatus Methanoplasma sp.]
MEDGSTEWKSIWKDEYLKVVCAFANSKSGGKLRIGINDDGEPVGVSDPKSTMKEISDTVINTLGIYPEISLDKKTKVITISVSPSSAPVDLRGKYYVRVGNTTREARGRELERIVSGKRGSSWIDAAVDGIDASQLDRGAFEFFRKKASDAKKLSRESLSVPDGELLDKLGLSIDGKLTRAAILLFHPHPDEILLGSYVKIGMFKGSDLLYHDEVSCPFILMHARVMDLLNTKYSKKGVTYDGISRVETDPYPGDALRECVTNAIMHNDYSSRTPIQIRIWGDEKMMVTDRGSVPSGWTVDTLLSPHASIPFNPVLARTLAYAGDVETWGRGIERIMESYEGYGPGMRPEFEITESSFSVTLRDVGASGGAPRKAERADGEIRAALAPKSISMLKALARARDMSSADLAEIAGGKGDPNFTYRRITPLVASGLIERTIPDKPNSSNQRYRITEKGELVARELE